MGSLLKDFTSKKQKNRKREAVEKMGKQMTKQTARQNGIIKVIEADNTEMAR
jgi:hypothetical protein